MIFNLTGDENGQAVSVFVNGELKTAISTHPRFAEIVAAATAGDESVVELFDIKTGLTRKLADQRLSDRLVIRGDKLLFDGDELHDALSEQILRHYEENVDTFSPLVAFLEKVQANQSESVRNGLYNWITQQDLTITESGSFLGFKGLRDDFSSITAGPGVVNDVEQDGHLDNTPGNVLEVARSYVDDNADVACSTGLHVGTRRYATDFAQGKLVVCEVDPRNVVSVPNDGHEKIRCSKYVVIEEAEPEYGALWYANQPVDEDAEYYDADAFAKKCYEALDNYSSTVDGDDEDFDDHGNYDDDEDDYVDAFNSSHLHVEYGSSVSNVATKDDIAEIQRQLENLQTVSNHTDHLHFEINSPKKFDSLGRPIPPRGPDGKFLKKS